MLNFPLTDNNELNIQEKSKACDRQKRVFVASMATENNTFSPLGMDMDSFRAALYARAGQHPDYPTLCSAPIVVARRYASDYDWHLIEGSAYWAEPGGIMLHTTYENLRDSLLKEVQQALPLDAVILGLHGAMVADGYDDCEGDLLYRIRQLAGDNCLITATMDPHNHLTPAKLRSSDFLMCFKEFPHTDFVDCAEKLVFFTKRFLDGSLQPSYSVFDCRMIDIFPTSYEPMKGFIAKIRHIEKTSEEVIAISLIHGFMAADVPEMGTKILVVTDNAAQQGDILAKELAQEIFSMKGSNMLSIISMEEAVIKASQCRQKPVVLADVWDNPGGGVPGDSTHLLSYLLQKKVKNVAFSSLWDPQAVKECMAAGTGAQIRLQFGGKSCAAVGKPIDRQVQIKHIAKKAFQSFGASKVSLGEAVVIELDGIEAIIHSSHIQTYEPDIFYNLGINLDKKDLIVVKSTNHFLHAFSRLTNHIYYVDAPTCYPNNPKTNRYCKVRRPFWPKDELEWRDIVSLQGDFSYTR